MGFNLETRVQSFVNDSSTLPINEKGLPFSFWSRIASLIMVLSVWMNVHECPICTPFPLLLSISGQWWIPICKLSYSLSSCFSFFLQNLNILSETESVAQHFEFNTNIIFPQLHVYLHVLLHSSISCSWKFAVFHVDIYV